MTRQADETFDFVEHLIHRKNAEILGRVNESTPPLDLLAYQLEARLHNATVRQAAKFGVHLGDKLEEKITSLFRRH